MYTHIHMHTATSHPTRLRNREVHIASPQLPQLFYRYSVQ